MEELSNFDELILSWNGLRPSIGKWTFWVSLLQGQWSPWIRYAEWGHNTQKTYQHSIIGSRIESYQDAVYAKDGLCTAFRIKVTCQNGTNLENLHSLYACISNLSNFAISPPKDLPPIQLSNFPKISQLILNHPRAKDFCSPASTSAVISYLSKTKICPIEFAKKVHDMEFDIYGNWILNTAQSYEELKEMFRIRTQRLGSFQTLHSYLLKGLPVIVSVRGPLPGSYLPLTFGHLLTVIGYKDEKVLCMDPAFPEDAKTHVAYNLNDFLAAWARRQNIAYVFTQHP